jgi:hypothetical protein
MRGWVEVPGEVLRGALLAAGFSLVPRAGEEVFIRPHARDPRYAVRVYTTLSSAAESARGCGEDAIRVVVTFDGPDGTRGIWKSRPVHRTGTVEGVVERTLARMRDGYGYVNGILKNPSYRRAS